MKRRDLLKSTALVLGYTMVGGGAAALLNGCKADSSPMWTPSFFSRSELRLLQEVAERIIPETDTPGAREAFVDRYIDEAVHNNFTEPEQKQFQAAISRFDVEAERKFDRKFINLEPKQMDEVLQLLSDEADDRREVDASPQVFDQMRELSVSGYFTSEIGATKALVFDPLPGPFQGCIDATKVGGTYAY